VEEREDRLTEDRRYASGVDRAHPGRVEESKLGGREEEQPSEAD
jgi:hypothetical protein